VKRHHTFPAQPGSVKAARAAIHDALTGVDPSVVESVVLMVSELTTNAILHARTEFTVELETSADQLRVTVSDAGPGDPALKTPARDTTTGRGLQIVERLADQWGIADGTPGKSVWFVVRTGTGGARTRQTRDTAEPVTATPPMLDPSNPRDGQVRNTAELDVAA
jgi:anti-sigma regulatory factor (Ser/Thr protein kinase)